MFSPPLGPEVVGHTLLYNRHKLNLCENLKIFLIGCKIKHSLVNLQIFFAKSYGLQAFSYKKYHFYAISLID